MKTKNAIILMFISLLFINCKQSKECEKTNTEMDKTSKKTKVMKLISENTKPGESNVTLEDVALLKKTIFFSKDDEANLKLAAQDYFPKNDGVTSKNTNFTAFINAKIYITPTYVVENGILLIQEGRVINVGQGIKLPENTVLIDLEGKSIYPSFVDIYSLDSIHRSMVYF